MRTPTTIFLAGQTQLTQAVINRQWWLQLYSTIKNSDCKDTKTWKAHVPEWLHKYGNVFSKNKSERIPIQKLYDHVIDFVEGTTFSKPAKVYLFSLAERNSLDMWINEEFRKGYIQPSTSPIAAPFFFVKKHNGSLWPVIDYRALNGITVKNCYPISWIADLIKSLNKASIFTKIDLRWGTIMFVLKKGMNERQCLL